MIIDINILNYSVDSSSEIPWLAITIFVIFILVFFLLLAIGYLYLIYKFLIFPGVLNNNILLIIIGALFASPIIGLIFYLVAKDQIQKREIVNIKK